MDTNDTLLYFSDFWIINLGLQFRSSGPKSPKIVPHKTHSSTQIVVRLVHRFEVESRTWDWILSWGSEWLKITLYCTCVSNLRRKNNVKYLINHIISYLSILNLWVFFGFAYTRQSKKCLHDGQHVYNMAVPTSTLMLC